VAEAYVDIFESQYRLPPSALTEYHRLDRIRARVLDKAFAQAFEPNGFPAEGELCIRNVVAPVCLSLKRTDEYLVNDWSLAIAQALAGAIRGGQGTNVVFYHSRRQALLDFAISVARGDLRRVWVWRQLGLWRSCAGTATESESVFELVTALCAEAELLTPTLQALAEAGWLSAIVHRLTEEQWETLASAALQKMGAGHLLDDTSATPTSRAVRNALRVLNGSPLLGAITSSGSRNELSIAACRAVAVLAVLGVEPMLLATETAQSMISILAETIRAPRDEISTMQLASLELEPTKPESEEVESAQSAIADQHGEASDEFELGPNASDPLSPRSLSTNETPSTTEAEQLAASADQVEPARVLPALNPRNESAEKETKSIDLRRRAFTRFGGLLFLLGVIEDLELPEEIVNHELLGARPFTWVMHQLGLALATMQPNDPAALAFAGLPPQRTSPADEEQPSSELEAAALNSFVTRIVERLRGALEFDDESESALLNFVCYRRAEVVADPGWIELRFSLDEVATEIRSAGLDLDPGYVPWLGLVVKFVYE